MKKNLSIIVCVVLLIALGVGISAWRGRRNIKAENVKSSQSMQSKEISYKGESGKSALELLKLKYQVKEKKYSFGTMVQGINGVNADSKHFWSLYVNGKMAEVGAGSYLTENGDVVTWKYEKIK